MQFHFSHFSSVTKDLEIELGTPDDHLGSNNSPSRSRVGSSDHSHDGSSDMSGAGQSPGFPLSPRDQVDLARAESGSTDREGSESGGAPLCLYFQSVLACRTI